LQITHCLKNACQNVEDASNSARLQFDSNASPQNFLPQQLLLLDKHSFPGNNQKLDPKWSGSHKILRLKGNSNVKIQLRHNHQKTVVHANQLKPYFVVSKYFATFPDVFPASITNWQTAPLHYSSFPDDVQLPEPEDYSPAHLRLLPLYAKVTGHNPSSDVPISPSLQHTCNRVCTESFSSKFQTQSNNFSAPPSLHTHFHTRTLPANTRSWGEIATYFSPGHI
jgi:hypothetical protein